MSREGIGSLVLFLICSDKKESMEQKWQYFFFQIQWRNESNEKNPYKYANLHSRTKRSFVRDMGIIFLFRSNRFHGGLLRVCVRARL